jgi:hypothetical protein
LREDPFEQNNLAEREGKELRRMMGGLVAALDQHQGLYPMDRDSGTELRPKLPEP